MNTKQLKSLLTLLEDESALAEAKEHPYKIGAKYLIRTVTHYYLGQLESVGSHELVLSQAGWVADTGRYYHALSTGKIEEFEPCTSRLIVGRGAIVDCAEWKRAIPTEVV